jgi:hypothetical protein
MMDYKFCCNFTLILFTKQVFMFFLLKKDVEILDYLLYGKIYIDFGYSKNAYFFQ